MSPLLPMIVVKCTLPLAAMVACLFRRDLFSWRAYPLAAQLLLAGCVEALAGYLAAAQAPNLWLYDLYVPIELVLLSAVALPAIGSKAALYIIGTWVLACLVIYAGEVGGAMAEGLFVSTTYTVGSLCIVVQFTLLLVVLSLNATAPLQGQALFWCYLGHVFFFAGMLPLLSLLNALNARNSLLADDLYVVNDVLHLARYGMIAIPLLVFRQGTVLLRSHAH